MFQIATGSSETLVLVCIAEDIRLNIKYFEAENRLRFLDRTYLSKTYSVGLN
jgi:hypothetical protein